jgi:GNAT superfamily N-acetyltransferase
VVPGSGVQAETLATGKPVETSRENGAISVLLGHVVATKTDDKVATDQSMGVPDGWDSPSLQPTSLGHQEAGRTIVLHSVAILPGYQGRGIGRTLMMAYMQQMNGAGIADRLALIAHDVCANLPHSSLPIPRSLIFFFSFSPLPKHEANASKHKSEWYEKLGFMNKGKSEAQFGGGGWIDLVFI